MLNLAISEHSDEAAFRKKHMLQRCLSDEYRKNPFSGQIVSLSIPIMNSQCKEGAEYVNIFGEIIKLLLRIVLCF